MKRLAVGLVSSLMMFAAAAAVPPPSLPDWSGWWVAVQPMQEEWTQKTPPLNARARASWDRRLVVDDNPDPLRYCRPLTFTGYSGGFEGGLEFLFTPGRVTMTTEDGRLRRIYTDGRVVPANQEPSAQGASTGRWEGLTLVVETTHLDPENAYPNASPGGMPIGRNVRITERIAQRDVDTLAFDIETVAPEVLSAPDRRTRVYRRLDKAMAQELTFCARKDRSLDEAGRQRFDLTPPPDLPPPPKP